VHPSTRTPRLVVKTRPLYDPRWDVMCVEQSERREIIATGQGATDLRLWRIPNAAQMASSTPQTGRLAQGLASQAHALYAAG